jgi:hypothetical protein
MHTKRFVVAGLASLAMAVTGSIWAYADESELRETFKAASKDLVRGVEANDSPAFQKLLLLLPKDNTDGTYIVEGDISVTPKELEEYLLGFVVGSASIGSNPELKVNLHDGERDYYANPAARTLTYAVLRMSFGGDASRYQEVVALMERATGDWEGECPSCNIDFRHESQHDAAPSLGAVNFIVEFRDAGGAYIAKAFFPHDTGKRRTVVIDPSFFSTTFDRRGVLRHELGHVLGYRHEHIDGIPGCFAEQNNWLPLTKYDPHSVMHYFCGGGGSFKLEISGTDRAGHKKLYTLTKD